MTSDFQLWETETELYIFIKPGENRRGRNPGGAPSKPRTLQNCPSRGPLPLPHWEEGESQQHLPELIPQDTASQPGCTQALRSCCLNCQLQSHPVLLETRHHQQKERPVPCLLTPRKLESGPLQKLLEKANMTGAVLCCKTARGWPPPSRCLPDVEQLDLILASDIPTPSYKGV